MSAATTERPPSAIGSVLHSPLYRGSTVSLLLGGLGMSAAAPQIAQYLVGELGASLPVAGLYYLTNLVAPIAGFLVGRRSDRTGNRLGFFRLCAVAGFVGWGIIALAGQVWIPFAVNAIVLAFAGAAVSQLFAAVSDGLHAEGHPHPEGVVSIVRMALTGGWIVGPVAGSFLAAAVGPRWLMAAVGFTFLVQIVPLGLQRDPRPEHHVDVAKQAEHVVERRGFRVMAPLLVFTGFFLLVYAGEPIKYGYLPIYMNRDLHLPAAISGAVIGIQPLVEFVLMPLAAFVAARIGAMRLMVLGAAFGVGANLLFATATGPVPLFGGQILMGGVWGVFAGLGIIVAQRLLPGAAATASAIFMSANAVASALGGLAGGLGVAVLGLPLVFVIPAILAAAGGIGIAVMSRTRPDGSARPVRRTTATGARP